MVIRLPLMTSQSKALPPEWPVTSASLSGLYATANTAPGSCLPSVVSRRLLRASHRQMPPAEYPAASSRPCGLNATASTLTSTERRLVSTEIWSPLLGSHRQMLPSPPPAASTEPSGVNATEKTSPAPRLASVVISCPVRASHIDRK